MYYYNPQVCNLPVHHTLATTNATNSKQPTLKNAVTNVYIGVELPNNITTYHTF